MQCRQCGTEIADKAIVCFRCGASTTDPVRKAVPLKPRRSPWIALALVLVLVMVAAYFWRMSGTTADAELPELVAGLALGAAVVVTLLVIFRRR